MLFTHTLHRAGLTSAAYMYMQKLLYPSTTTRDFRHLFHVWPEAISLCINFKSHT